MRAAQIRLDYDFSMRYAIQEAEKKATAEGFENYSLAFGITDEDKEAGTVTIFINEQ